MPDDFVAQNAARANRTDNSIMKETPSSADEASSSLQNNGGQPNDTDAARPEEAKQPSKLKQWWTKIGLDVGTVMMMLKGSLAPTIAIAMYQSSAVAAQFTTLGYLIAIMSLLGFPIMPRGKFIQTMTLNIISVGLSAAVNLLSVYCVVQARLNTTPGRVPSTAYNSSANAVAAVFLVWQVYLVNYLRAARPQFQFPAIVYSIFVIVSASYSPSFPDMAYGLSFMRELLETFLTGFGLATAVHFLIFPVTSRTVIFKQMAGYLSLLNGMLVAQKAYMQSLEDIDPVSLREKILAEAREGDKKHKQSQKETKKLPGPLTTPAAEGMNTVFLKLVELHTKLNTDIPTARREFAMGKLESNDIKQMWEKMRGIFVPILGLHSIIDILQRRAEMRGWADADLPEEEMRVNREQIHNLHTSLKALSEPYDHMTKELGAGIQHVLLTLELVKPAKQKKEDEESRSEKIAPGDLAFAETMKGEIDQFFASREVTLKAWCDSKGLNLPAGYFQQAPVEPTHGGEDEDIVPEQFRRQLYFVLYIEYLLWRAGQAVLELVLWADKVKQDGKMDKKKLIFPGSKTIYKWARNIFAQDDISKDDNFVLDMETGGSESILLGTSFETRKDPEHLPPRTTRERIGEALRLIPKFFRTDGSAFGLRVVAAVMSISIVGYLHDTRTFYLEQRLLWAQIMVAISMSRLQGASVFNFVLRIFGTLIAMCASYVIWYITNGTTPGAIVFLWLWMTCAFYIVLKLPKYTIVGILSIVTSVLIIGYELQVRVLGLAAATANGQPAYPTYELAPYRLAMVVGGLAVAFIWTIFPYPISESSELRRDLGTSIYMLANFYSVVHEVIKSRVTGSEGDIRQKGTHASNLEKARRNIFGKSLLLLNQMRMNSSFSKFQLKVGGRFPSEEYEALIECVQRLFNYFTLMSYASQTYSGGETSSEDKSKWSNDFRRLATGVKPTSDRITSLLSLLASSLINGQPLPPYLEMPEPYGFSHKLESIDHDILSIRHIAEPEYSAFAVIQICGVCVSEDMKKLTGHIKTLVGEIDFSFHALNATGRGSDASSLDSNEDKSKTA